MYTFFMHITFTTLFLKPELLNHERRVVQATQRRLAHAHVQWRFHRNCTRNGAAHEQRSRASSGSLPGYSNSIWVVPACVKGGKAFGRKSWAKTSFHAAASFSLPRYTLGSWLLSPSADPLQCGGSLRCPSPLAGTPASLLLRGLGAIEEAPTSFTHSLSPPLSPRPTSPAACRFFLCCATLWCLDHTVLSRARLLLLHARSLACLLAELWIVACVFSDALVALDFISLMVFNSSLNYCAIFRYIKF